uniref:Uncharacterized protein n=1 Tax=Capra hircus TaxID=9925 RepID=A0A8C2S734_CAPHI
PCTGLALFTKASGALSPFYTLVKGEQEVAVTRDPAGSAPTKSTVANIQTEPRAEHTVWSLLNTLLTNTCCGFAVLAHSVKSRDRKMVGDITGAQSFSTTPQCIEIKAIVLELVITFLLSLVISESSLVLLEKALEGLQNHLGR